LEHDLSRKQNYDLPAGRWAKNGRIGGFGISVEPTASDLGFSNVPDTHNRYKFGIDSRVRATGVAPECIVQKRFMKNGKPMYVVSEDGSGLPFQRTEQQLSWPAEIRRLRVAPLIAAGRQEPKSIVPKKSIKSQQARIVKPNREKRLVLIKEEIANYEERIKRLRIEMAALSRALDRSKESRAKSS
jgi:hypothetical protein